MGALKILYLLLTLSLIFSFCSSEDDDDDQKKEKEEELTPYQKLFVTEDGKRFGDYPEPTPDEEKTAKKTWKIIEMFQKMFKKQEKGIVDRPRRLPYDGINVCKNCSTPLFYDTELDYKLDDDEMYFSKGTKHIFPEFTPEVPLEDVNVSCTNCFTTVGKAFYSDFDGPIVTH